MRTQKAFMNGLAIGVVLATCALMAPFAWRGFLAWLAGA